MRRISSSTSTSRRASARIPICCRTSARFSTETGLPPARLKLEITEGVVLENSERSSEVLDELRALGVQLGLDDFGMGYSALSYLQRFPFQTIKIDRAVRQRHGGRRQHRDHPRDRVAGRRAWR